MTNRIAASQDGSVLEAFNGDELVARATKTDEKIDPRIHAGPWFIERPPEWRPAKMGMPYDLAKRVLKEA